MHDTPRKGNGKQSSSGKGKYSKSSQSAGKGTSKQGKVDGKSKGKSKGSKVPQVRTMVKLRKLVYLVLKSPKQKQVRKLRNLHSRITLTLLPRTILGLMMAGVVMNGMMTGARLDGMKVGNKPMTIPQTQF